MKRRSFLAILGFAPLTGAVSAKVTTPEPPLTLAVAKSKLEEGLVVKEGFPCSRCQTGNTYIVITAGGVKDEGAAMIGWCKSKEHAIQMWLDAAMEYATRYDTNLKKERWGKTLYWRELPTVETREVTGQDPTYQVYSRFVITSEPELFDTPEQLRADDRFSPGKEVYEIRNYLRKV